MKYRSAKKMFSNPRTCPLFKRQRAAGRICKRYQRRISNRPLMRSFREWKFLNKASCVPLPADEFAEIKAWRGMVCTFPQGYRIGVDAIKWDRP